MKDREMESGEMEDFKVFIKRTLIKSIASLVVYLLAWLVIVGARAGLLGEGVVSKLNSDDILSNALTFTAMIIILLIVRECVMVMDTVKLLKSGAEIVKCKIFVSIKKDSRINDKFSCKYIKHKRAYIEVFNKYNISYVNNSYARYITKADKIETEVGIDLECGEEYEEADENIK